MGMNTNRTGMRTVLAAAAAGALIMGSAAGAMAAPASDKPAPQATVKLQSVSINGHSPINVSTRDAQARAIKFVTCARPRARTPATVDRP